MPLSRLKEGDVGIVVSLSGGDLSLKLMEMGFLPGELISIDKIAPLGDPLSVKIGTYRLSLRKEEAKEVMVRRMTSL
ncbi:MAG: ferrous iron transport protein A [Chitinophagales bacterium]|nr:ferrous iron transport protein A [Chitinophagales bacterium]